MGGAATVPFMAVAPPASLKDMEECHTAVLLENKRPNVQCDAFLDGEGFSRESAVDRKSCRDLSPARRFEHNMNCDDARAGFGYFTDAVC